MSFFDPRVNREEVVERATRCLSVRIRNGSKRRATDVCVGDNEYSETRTVLRRLHDDVAGQIALPGNARIGARRNFILKPMVQNIWLKRACECSSHQRERWQPSKKMRQLGFLTKPFGEPGPGAQAEAMLLNENGMHFVAVSISKCNRASRGARLVRLGKFSATPRNGRRSLRCARIGIARGPVASIGASSA